MAAFIEQYLPQIRQLMQQYGIQQAYAFGSAVKGTMTTDSDVDFLFRFPPDMDHETYYTNYVSLMHALEDLLKRPVDLVAEETVQDPYFAESINRQKCPFYNASGRKKTVKQYSHCYTRH